MKIKDLLANIEHYRKEYPDIDDWDVYTEQPELIVPEHNISFKDWERAYQENQPTIDYNEEEKQWTVSAGYDDFAYFDSKEEAEEWAKNYYQTTQDYYLDLLQTHQKIENLKKEGWKFKTDSEGWVYRDVGDAHCHTLFTEEKIFTINNNY